MVSFFLTAALPIACISGILVAYLYRCTDSPRIRRFGAIIACTFLLVVTSVGYSIHGSPGLQALHSRQFPQTPRTAFEWSDLSEMYAARGREAEALFALSKATDIAPRDSNLLFQYAARLLAAEQERSSSSPQVHALSARILALDPEHPGGLFLAGLLAQQAGELQRARQSWQKLYQKLPPGTPLRTMIGARLQHLEQQDPVSAGLGNAKVEQ